MHQKYR